MFVNISPTTILSAGMRGDKPVEARTQKTVRTLTGIFVYMNLTFVEQGLRMMVISRVQGWTPPYYNECNGIRDSYIDYTICLLVLFRFGKSDSRFGARES